MAPLDSILTNYDPRATEESTLNRGDVVEIQGPAASGKTQCLHFFAMTTCLPREWKVDLSVRGSSRPPRLETIAIGGRQKSVAVIDCDGRFEIDRAYHLVRSHLIRRVQEHAATIPSLYSAEATAQALHEETLRSLARLHIFRPTSSESLTATLLRLPTYATSTCSAELAFLLIDNLSAFYWQDRFQLERPSNLPKRKGEGPGRQNPLSSTLQALQDFRRTTGAVVVLTNWAFPGQGDRQPTKDSPFYRQHLIKPYPTPFVPATDGTTIQVPELDQLHPFDLPASAFAITHHVTLHPVQSKAVAVNISLENASKEEPYRLMDQQEMGSMAYVRLAGIENGDELGRWELVIRQNTVEGL